MPHAAISHPRIPTDSFDTDVLIVGAGPSGLTLATALATKEIRTVVIYRLTERTGGRSWRFIAPRGVRHNARASEGETR